ncbi:hypothetical protein CRUP_022738 [Coryphaenoides rupestris]|nr:hypothetical protein CRUP_022738 [Coryphaenoides rupestris]
MLLTLKMLRVSSRSLASKTPVGFVGLGNMGSPMAKNLLRNGYPVIATDVFPESRKELQDLGAQVFDTPADVAEKADRIITMLPSSPNVIEVYTGATGILKKVKKGTLLIDSSTIDPAVSREMAVAAEKMGAVFMDAPVSGVSTPPHRIDQLSMMRIMMAVMRGASCGCQALTIPLRVTPVGDGWDGGGTTTTTTTAPGAQGSRLIRILL